MYTGIIHHQATIEEVQPGLSLRVKAPREIVSRLSEGSSVNLAGVCFTARNLSESEFWVDAMPQTVALTTVGEWKAGTIVNIEPSLRVGDELGGHFVYGHVDGVGEVKDVKEEGNARLITVEPPNALMQFIVDQGSVTIDGVSLTIARCDEQTFTVSLIPETLSRTTLKDLATASNVNLEVDMMMKYARN